MPTAMFTVSCDWVAGNNQREVEAQLERWFRSSETGLPEARPRVARCQAPSPSPSPQHHCGVIASRAIGANGCRSAGSRTGADRGYAAVAGIMGNDLGSGGLGLVGARLKTACLYFAFRGGQNSFSRARVPRGFGVAFNQQSNQAQQRLMLGISPSAQKCADLDIGHVTSRWNIRLVPDEYVPGTGITAEKPPISIRAAVKLSSLHGHRLLPDLCYPRQRPSRLRETRECRTEPAFRPADRSTLSASSISSTDQTRNCSITSGSIAVFDNAWHLRACSRMISGSRMRSLQKD